ncbi:MAG: transposase, partial [Erysipelotrichaceae bacterium]|nr:transposase [Erysipelotrichaceae bacterium]
MGRKAKYSAEQKVQACEDYLSGKKTAIQIARELGMGNYGDDKIRDWARIYRINGSKIFDDKPHNRSY